MKTISKITMMVMVILITSCQKKPIASFTISDKTVSPGQKITCTNKSVDGYSYLWTTSGGTSTSKDITITAGSSAGERTVKLEVFSKKGKKTDEYVDTYTVVANNNTYFTGTYNGSISNDFYLTTAVVSTNGSTKITVAGDISLDFTITSSTAGTLVQKYIYSGNGTYNFKSGTITKNGNTLSINTIVDYTDPVNPQDNFYNYSSTDILVKQ